MDKKRDTRKHEKNELRCIAVDSTFRRRLKAELFSRAYGVSINI